MSTSTAQAIYADGKVCANSSNYINNPKFAKFRSIISSHLYFPSEFASCNPSTAFVFGSNDVHLSGFEDYSSGLRLYHAHVNSGDGESLEFLRNILSVTNGINQPDEIY